MSDAPHRADGTGLIDLDPWLEPFAAALRERFRRYQTARAEIDRHGGLTGGISTGHEYFGLNRGERSDQRGVWYREWAPAAVQLSLIGDFNGWDRGANPLTRDEWGVWSTFLPDREYGGRLTHGSWVKVHVRTTSGGLDRIPAYIRRVVQDPDSFQFTGQYWDPPLPHQWQHAAPPLRHGLRIYEAHVGMAQEAEKVSSFAEFTASVLPRVADLGYNAIQLMAVAEHPYYGSFGYHVSSFFAVSSRFGTPEELKALIDAAHARGILVLMDLIQSHAVSNVNEGLNRFDGTDFQYFHAGARGMHPAWGSLCFDYARYEVRRFLLSNVRFWLEEFRFDGFRWDGATSMLYLDHGLGKPFQSYETYFSDNVDAEAVTYLMLANELMKAVNAHSISIAEDVSGMVGLARPVLEGGLGFDYRLAMGVPDYWVRLVETCRDEDWNLGELFHTLLNRRHGEKHVGYVESHDQALVGDKTLAFRLMNSEMYTHMRHSDSAPVVERGIALLKLIRLVTFALAGEAYLNFVGNEFGHPEWVDFPREGNGYSYQHARRQWSLVDRTDLKYRGLSNFDREMLHLDERFDVLEDPLIELLSVNEACRLLVFRRGPLVFAFNFHPSRSYADLPLPVPDSTDYRVVLNTDDAAFEGHGRSSSDALYPLRQEPLGGREQSLRIYLPSRTAQVLQPIP